jgi:hypothetical protein
LGLLAVAIAVVMLGQLLIQAARRLIDLRSGSEATATQRIK